MPFESNAQRKFMFAKHPKIAEEFAAKTPSNAKLPEHVVKMADGGLVPEGNWASIKNWVVSHAPTDDSEPKHASMPEMPGFSDGGAVPMDPGIPGLPGVPELPGVPRRHLQPKGYANGGDVSGPDFLQGLTNGSIPMAGAVQNQPAQPLAAPVAPNPMPMPQAPSSDQQASQILGGGADARAALAQKLGAPSIGGSLSLLGGGIGDAITRASGHGDSGFVNQILGQQNRRENLGLENFDKSTALGKEKFGLSQALEAKDPNSQLSKVAQQTYGALLSKSGFKPQDIAKMPASLIADLTGKNVDQIKAESEAKMAAASLGLKNVTEQANIQHQKAEEANQTVGRQQDAAKTLAGRSTLQKVTDTLAGLLPGGNPAIDTLKGQLPGAIQPPAPAIAPHPQDDVAIQWAQSHPNDPRAAQILKIHGVR